MKKKIDIDNSIIYKSMSIEDLAEAIPCIERDGYFSDTPDFSEYHYGELNEVYASYHHEYAFFGIGDNFETSFKYFAPESSIVFEKEQRPYCFIDELPFKLGDEVELRSIHNTKDSSKYKFMECVLKYEETLGAILDQLRFNYVGSSYGLTATPEDLMTHWQVCINGEWQDMSVDA